MLDKWRENGEVIMNLTKTPKSDPDAKKFTIISKENLVANLPQIISDFFIANQALNYRNFKQSNPGLNPTQSDIALHPAYQIFAQDLLAMAVDDCLCLKQEDIDALKAQIKAELTVELTASLTLELTASLTAALTVSLPPVIVPLVVAAVLALLHFPDWESVEAALNRLPTKLLNIASGGDAVDDNGFSNGVVMTNPDYVGQIGLAPGYRVGGTSGGSYPQADTANYFVVFRAQGLQRNVPVDNNWLFLGTTVPLGMSKNVAATPPYYPPTGDSVPGVPPAPSQQTNASPATGQPPGWQSDGGSAYDDTDSGASGGFDWNNYDGNKNW